MHDHEELPCRRRGHMKEERGCLRRNGMLPPHIARRRSLAGQKERWCVDCEDHTSISSKRAPNIGSDRILVDQWIQLQNKLCREMIALGSGRGLQKFERCREQTMLFVDNT